MEKVTMYVPREQRDLIKAAAALRGVSIEDWIVKYVSDLAKNQILDAQKGLQDEQSSRTSE